MEEESPNKPFLELKDGKKTTHVDIRTISSMSFHEGSANTYGFILKITIKINPYIVIVFDNGKTIKTRLLKKDYESLYNKWITYRNMKYEN